jgi:hypothetical protein
MKTGIVLALLPVVLLSGCCNYYKNRVNQQLWERELRLQENCIYQLRWQLEDKCRELDAANARNNSLNRQTDVLRDDSHGPNFAPPAGVPAPSGTSGGRSTEAPRLPPAPKLPDIDIGQPFTPGGSNAPPAGSGSSLKKGPELRGPTLTQASYTTVGPESRRPNEMPSDRPNPDAEVERIILNPGMTGEVNTSGKPGAGVLNVVIEQRDARGSRVLAPGDISIAVVDPAIEGDAGRIAKWNFEADKIAQYVRRNHDGGSLRFELHWPTPPEHSDLRLFVRFTTFDGRRLEANLPIEAQVAGGERTKHSWTRSMASLAARLDEAVAAMPQTIDSSDKPSVDTEVKQSSYERAVAEAEKADPIATETTNSQVDEGPGPADGNPYTHSHRPVWAPNRPRPD